MEDILGVEALKNSGQARIPQSRKEKIQAELKILEWHKMANAAAIKSALVQTKSLKTQAAQQQVHVKPQYTEEDEKWIKKVIQQEHIKPLEVSKDFVLEYERREQENNERLTHQVEKHIDTLKQLRQKLEARHDLKLRTEEYRTWQREFLPKKHAVMIGKTLDEIEVKKSPTTRDPDDDIRDDLMANTLNKDKHKSSQELNAVLDSLSRLADLEQRISSLEKDNRYDQMQALEKPTANQRTAFEFRKKRGEVNTSSASATHDPNGTGPVGLVYEIRQKRPGQSDTQKNWKVQLPSGTGSAAVRAKHAQMGGGGGYGDDEFYGEDDEESVGRGPGVFITAQSSTDRLKTDREAARRERLRNQALAPAGVKNLKSRVQTKKVREKEQMIGQKRHEEAMKEMARRKQEQMQKKLGASAAAKNKVQAPAKGMASGVRSKNKHMQEFEKMKTGHNKRKDEINKSKVVTKGSGPGIEKRFASQTAPAYSSKITQNVSAAHARAGRMPTTNNGGNITRRADQPTRRQPGGAQAPLNKTAPPPPTIAVTGMGGLRAIKAGMHRQPGPSGMAVAGKGGRR